ncbi:hypothetical protein [Pseudomonas monteilii]|uniref:hypothetical protein n=1 Tax=Pseudomonas monteilii TaxID=76759 RepID=UPI0036E1C49C
MVTSTSTTAASLAQIAALVGVAPNHLRTDLLPPSTPVHTGEPGRPMQVITLEDLADFVARRTGHLSNAEVRLRLAMTNRCARRHASIKNGRPGPFYLVPNDDGTFAMKPLLGPNDLTFDEQLALKAAITTEKQP